MAGNGVPYLFGGLFLASALVIGIAITMESSGATAAPPTPAPYIPGLGEFMLGSVEPHHTKLWFAGAAGNWTLAAYEGSELRETFDDIKTYHATWKNMPIADMADATIEPSLKEVEGAIAAKNVTAFKHAYGALTAACNACHNSAQHGFVVIRVPATNPFSDQNLDSR